MPILGERRKRVLESRLKKKKYPKTAAQLWQTITLKEQFYWNEVARQLRQDTKQGSLSLKGCLIHGGRASESKAYVWHAEVAVVAYLELPTPVEDIEAKGEELEIFERTDKKSESPTTKLDLIETTSTELLDTLPNRFEYEPKMRYSHFAYYDYHAVRVAEGKHQTAMLRQLANLFDKTGKVLFYYYIVPHLCKQSYPSTPGETVTGQATDAWMRLPGAEKKEWCNASANVKKMLGDGDLDGLELLELGSLGPEVLRLHELAVVALGIYAERRKDMAV